MNETQKELMTIDQFLEIYSISRSMYFSQVKKKLLKVTPIARRTFIKRCDAEEWLTRIGGNA